MFCTLQTATCTDLDRYIAFCHFPHIEANCWNHVFVELTALWEREREGGREREKLKHIAHGSIRMLNLQAFDDTPYPVSR